MLAGLRDGRGFQRPAGGDFAEQGHDLVAGDQLLGDGGGFAGGAAVVLGDEFELLAEQAAGGIELFDGQQRALVGRLAKGRFLAR